MKELYELKGEGHSIRGIARELCISRNIGLFKTLPTIEFAEPLCGCTPPILPFVSYSQKPLGVC